MFVARVALFRLYEPARYLVSKQRSTEALVVLQNIAAFNADAITLDMEDVGTRSSPTETRISKAEDGNASEYRTPLEVPTPTSYASRITSRPGLHTVDSSSYIEYSTAREYGTPPPFLGSRKSSPPHIVRSTQGSVFHTPSEELSQARAFQFEHAAVPENESGIRPIAEAEFSGRPSEEELTLDDIDTVTENGRRANGILTLLDKTLDRLQLLFVPEWKKTTILMWLVWGLMSLAYGMWVSLSVLEFPQIGAWSIESSLGRRRSLALFTLATAMAMFVFTAVVDEWAVLASSMLISLAGTAMYAVLYGMTPEIFSIEIRGTACGTSAAISRL
ncbi:hypothetical protein QFC22_002626 [Naganishia vaughanmartiniae]|uniref:Uncharacterized protein n=1 Tax=Naganishia vaughanmartiniae TaxID=1424756 RepID=A0ACC2XAU4_9TREE|nr:hypothetical protein QFC22_002626 [Naganishia vaughanmartiniae]